LTQTFGFKFHPDRLYMTRTEMIMMNKMLNGIELSFFDTKMCDQCKEVTVLKHKKYCSVECMDLSDDAEEKKELEDYDESWDLD